MKEAASSTNIGSPFIRARDPSVLTRCSPCKVAGGSIKISFVCEHTNFKLGSLFNGSDDAYNSATKTYRSFVSGELEVNMKIFADSSSL